MQHPKFTGQFNPKTEKTHVKKIHIRKKLDKWVISEYTAHEYKMLALKGC